jgi:hypothetical protein
MIAEILLLIVFVALCIAGIHAVTRNGYLLSFLGQDESDITQRISESFDDVQFDLLDMQEQFLGDIEELKKQGNSKFFEIVDTSIGYTSAIKSRKESIEDDMSELENELEKRRSLWIRKILRPISEPLTECTTCMSSVWSVVILLTYAAWQPLVFLFFPFAVAGAITAIESLKKKINITLEDE